MQALDILIDIDEAGKVADPVQRQMIATQFQMRRGRRARLCLCDEKRSPQANRFYWGCVIHPVRVRGLEAGLVYTKTQWHAYFKDKYLPAEVFEVCGREIVTVGTTTKLDKGGFYDYVESVRTDEIVLQLGVVIEDPDTYQDRHGRFRSYNIGEPI